MNSQKPPSRQVGEWEDQGLLSPGPLLRGYVTFLLKSTCRLPLVARLLARWG